LKESPHTWKEWEAVQQSVPKMIWQPVQKIAVWEKHPRQRGEGEACAVVEGNIETSSSVCQSKVMASLVIQCLFYDPNFSNQQKLVELIG